MLTRKGLQALVAGIAEGAASAGITRGDARVMAAGIIDALDDAGAVTPNFDYARFTAALADALAARGVVTGQEVAA